MSKVHRHKAIELSLNQNIIPKTMPSVPVSRQGECIGQTSTRRGGLELTQYDTADTRSGYYSSYMVQMSYWESDNSGTQNRDTDIYYYYSDFQIKF